MYTEAGGNSLVFTQVGNIILCSHKRLVYGSTQTLGNSSPAVPAAAVCCVAIFAERFRDQAGASRKGSGQRGIIGTCKPFG
jgi:hypothetical protein